MSLSACFAVERLIGAGLFGGKMLIFSMNWCFKAVLNAEN
jgi:hypothetical protein